MKTFIGLVLILFFGFWCSAKTDTARAGTVAFVNVNVEPMDQERVLRGQTVVIRDGVIGEIG